MSLTPSTVTIAARVTPDVAEQLRAIAADHATTTSRLVAHILAGALHEPASGHDDS
jgi:hypothetical protein